jgi:pimeloyl-ACP methyl ester carboxylesterase
VPAGDVEVHLAEAGSGPPIVLLHGWPQHWWAWRRVLPHLARHHRVLCPDLRGQGWSSVPLTGYDKETLAGDLLGLLDALGLPKVIVVGHDWGGLAGLLAALRAPERFTGLVALGIAHPWPTAGSFRDGWRLGYQTLIAAPVLGPALVRAPGLVATALRRASAVPGTWAEGDLETYAAPLREPARAVASAALYRSFLLRELPAIAAGGYGGTRLRVRARLVVGDRDPVVTERMLTGATEHADDLEVTMLAGVGHFVPEEDPAAVLAAVRGVS